MGVWNTLSFGPGLVENGKVLAGIDSVEIDTNFGNHSVQGDQPRTGIGLVGANHRATDIEAVAARVAAAGAAMVLGSRRFAGAVPARSRLGNAVTRVAFRLVTGVPLGDTQTGLRAYPARMLP